LNRWLVIILLFLSTACAPEYSGKTPPPIVDGTIDLTGWDFERDGPVELKGEWLFAWEKFVEPAPWVQLKRELPHRAEVPALWSTLRHPELPTKSLPGTGYATYALRVVTSGDLTPMLTSMGVSVAGKVEVLDLGGSLREVHTVGQVGRSSVDEIPVATYDAPLSLGEAERPRYEVILLLTVSNHHHADGGIWRVPTLSSAKAAQAEYRWENFISIMLFGVLIMTGVYHLILYGLRGNSQIALYFGLLVLVFALRLWSMGVAQELEVGLSQEGYKLLRQVEYASMPLTVMMFGLYLGDLLKQSYFQRYRKVWAVAASTILLVLVVLNDPKSTTAYLWAYQLHVGVGLLFCVFALIHASIQGNQLARWSLYAFGLTVIGAVNDILLTQGVVNSIFMTPYMIMGFVMLQAAVISRYFASAFEQRDELNRRVLEKTTQLANESERRATAETALRLEAESKITLFSEVTHHLNNPLSHIQGEALAIRNTNRAISDTILELLPEDADDETSALREHFQKLFEDVERSQGAVESAQLRATDAIELLRRVSGVDGIPMEPTSLAEIMDILRKRGDVDLSFMDWRRFEEHNDHLVIGHRLVYGYLMRQVLHQMQSLSIAEEPGPETSKPVAEIQVEGDAKAFLRLSLPLEADLDMDSEISFREALEPMDYLAQTMHGAVYFSDESWSVIVRLLAHYPEERA